MNVRALERLRRRLAGDEPAYGLWVTLESPAVTEIAVALGLDWVAFEAEHGALDWQEIAGHLRAAARSDTVTLVRIAAADATLVKRALDLGADGVLVPWVESAGTLRDAVAFAHYPPAGRRGIGAERATGWGRTMAEHVREADRNVLVVPIIESVEGARQLDAMLEVPGVEVFFFGPADFSASTGHAGQWEGPGVAEAILEARQKIGARGRHCGILATSDEDLLRRREQGFRLLGVGADAPLLLGRLEHALALVGRKRGVRAGPG